MNLGIILLIKQHNVFRFHPVFLPMFPHCFRIQYKAPLLHSGQASFVFSNPWELSLPWPWCLWRHTYSAEWTLTQVCLMFSHGLHDGTYYWKGYHRVGRPFPVHCIRATRHWYASLMHVYVLPTTWLNRFLPRPYFLTVHGVLQETILECVARRNINNLRYADDTTLIAESEEELKSLLMKVNEEEWNGWLEPQ